MKNIPNILTIIRIVLVPIFLFFAFAYFCPGNLYIAFAIYAVASLTDYLDGYLARKYNVVSNIGKFLDPIADKVLFLAGLVVLCYFMFVYNLFSTSIIILIFISVFIIIARDYIVDAIRQIAGTKGKVIPADIYGKAKTFVQDFAMPILLLFYALVENSYLANSGVVQIVGYVGLALFFIGVVLTVASGINYFVKNMYILK